MVDTFPYTSPVGSFLPNSFGLYDIDGNAGEWCMDESDGPDQPHVVRGGGFGSQDQYSLNAAGRISVKAAVLYDWIGFRCVWL